jgi:hypothetical protein
LVAAIAISAVDAAACGGDPGTTGSTDASADSLTGGGDRDAAIAKDAADPAEIREAGDGAALRDSAAGGDTNGDSAALSPCYVHFDINHVLATGQSLSVGYAGSPPLTTQQPYANIMFVTGIISGATGLVSFVPLVEGDMVGGARVETMSSSFANHVTKAAREQILLGLPGARSSHDILVSAHGRGGHAYRLIKKGTAAYAEGMAQVSAAKTLAGGKSYVVRAVTNVHGESDHIAANTSYEANLREWQRDYETDVRSMTGQAQPVPMFQSQMSSWPRFLPEKAVSIIPAAQLAAHLNAPGRIILVGPKYHLPYAVDGVHLTNKGYQHMGEDFAKAYRRVVLEGKPWEPLRPKAIERNGTTIIVEFHVPVPPLVIDTTRVTNPGSFGFEWFDAGPKPAIASVAVTGPTIVTVKLAGPPGANGRLRYAHTGSPGAAAGPTTGPRGNLRDSDRTPSLNGHELFNWCVHFDQPVAD